MLKLVYGREKQVDGNPDSKHFPNIIALRQPNFEPPKIATSLIVNVCSKEASRYFHFTISALLDKTESPLLDTISDDDLAHIIISAPFQNIFDENSRHRWITSTHRLFGIRRST